MEERERRARPREHAHGDALGRLREQRRERRTVASEPDPAGEEPTRDVDVRLRGLDVGRDPRQGLGAVDEQLHAVAGTRREGAGVGPPPGRRRESTVLPDATEPAPVVRADRALDPVAEDVVDAVEPNG
jgi:hypothetical protein